MFKRNTKLILLGVLLFFVVYMFWPKGSKEGSWTVYGTDGCGWTRKQLSHMDEEGISYEYLNCDEVSCDGVSAYPTLKSPSGEVTEGFKKLK
jgi:hypothetical protein